MPSVLLGIGLRVSVNVDHGDTSRCGIEIMTLKDYQSIEQENFHRANKFKTSTTYSYQIV
jgi:hypothetical protein